MRILYGKDMPAILEQENVVADAFVCRVDRSGGPVCFWIETDVRVAEDRRETGTCEFALDPAPERHAHVQLARFRKREIHFFLFSILSFPTYSNAVTHKLCHCLY